jgi:hypothetical protein
MLFICSKICSTFFSNLSFWSSNFPLILNKSLICVWKYFDFSSFSDKTLFISEFAFSITTRIDLISWFSWILSKLVQTMQQGLFSVMQKSLLGSLCISHKVLSIFRSFTNFSKWTILWVWCLCCVRWRLLHIVQIIMSQFKHSNWASSFVGLFAGQISHDKTCSFPLSSPNTLLFLSKINI